MSGIKFLITLLVIYLVFRAIMRKVLSTLNTEGGGPLKGKLGEFIEQVKREMERARLEAEREAAGMDEEIIMADDPWAELRGERGTPREEVLEEEIEAPTPSRDLWDADDERPSLHERWDADDERPSLHERWDADEERPSLHERWEAVDETIPLWDRAEEAPRATKRSKEPAKEAPGTCRGRRRRRKRLKEAVIWKEILDRPVGLR